MVVFDDVSFSYDDGHFILRDLKLKVEEGEFCVITGESGIGKTTLIRLLLKEVEPVGGRIEVNGEDIGKIRPSGIPKYRRKLGVIFQDSKLVAERTVYENLELARMVYGWNSKDTESKITHVLKFLGIDNLHARFPQELSGGEKQKVCLARALLNDPKILLADEPTANLDPNASRDFVKLMELIHKQGVTVIMTTHALNIIKEEAEEYREIKLPVLGKEA
ncbi:MAG: ATP-binding cassette domain-containing protein [Lachnospiraceae bacterium]|nr:ATP-binding cassette domain-containing protein [Lachnospiraceae bacterium]